MSIIYLLGRHLSYSRCNGARSTSIVVATAIQINTNTGTIMEECVSLYLLHSWTSSRRAGYPGYYKYNNETMCQSDVYIYWVDVYNCCTGYVRQVCCCAGYMRARFVQVQWNNVSGYSMSAEWYIYTGLGLGLGLGLGFRVGV